MRLFSRFYKIFASAHILSFVILIWIKFHEEQSMQNVWNSPIFNIIINNIPYTYFNSLYLFNYSLNFFIKLWMLKFKIFPNVNTLPYPMAETKRMYRTEQQIIAKQRIHQKHRHIAIVVISFLLLKMKYPKVYKCLCFHS